MGNSGYHGLKDRRQRPVEQGAVTGYVGLSLLAAGVLGCVLFFSGVFIDEEVLLNIPPKPVVEKVYEHPRSCFDAGTSLFRISGSERQPITELQMIKVGSSKHCLYFAHVASCIYFNTTCSPSGVQ